MYLKEKKRRKRRRINFHFGQNCLKLCLSALDGSQDEMASCVVKISVTTQKSAEKPERGAAEWTKALASLSAEKKHLLKHWTLCNFTYLIKIVNVDVAIVIL